MPNPTKPRHSRTAIGISTTTDSMVSMMPKESPHPGIGVGALKVKDRAAMALLSVIDLVEDAAIAEMLGLHLRPAAEMLDGQAIDLGKAGDVFGRCGGGIPRAVIVPQRNGLRLGA